MKKLFNNNIEFQRLKNSIINNKFNGNLLILSKDEMSTFVFAKELAMIIFCNNHDGCGNCEGCIKTEKETNPDFIICSKDKNFQVDDANEIIENALLKPMIFDKKIYLITQIDKATISAQNKILKILEEPPFSVHFILTATNESKILPTIKSRCKTVTVGNVRKDVLEEYFGCSGQKFDLAYEYSEGYVGELDFALTNKNFEELNAISESIIFNLKSSKEVISYSSKISNSKEQFELVLKLLLLKFTKLINSGNIEYSNLCLSKIILEITNAKKQIESNVNISIIADNLLMKILEIKYLNRG